MKINKNYCVQSLYKRDYTDYIRLLVALISVAGYKLYIAIRIN